jgi:hypothetical protein
MNPQDKSQNLRVDLKTLVRSAYALQKLRIAMGARLSANFASKLTGGVNVELDEESAEIIAEVKKSYILLSTGVAKITPKTFNDNYIEGCFITSYTEFCLIEQFLAIEKSEKDAFASLHKILMEFPIYDTYLKNIRGVGPAMAAVIISEFDISKARYVSSLWKYAGLDVGDDGRGRSRRKEHLTTHTYIAKDGEEKEKLGITFNSFLKTKLVGVLASSFLRSKSPYAEVYYNTKTRLENHEKYKEPNQKAHRHAMAMRKMIKMFLADLYDAWRSLEGLPVERPYYIAKLGMQPHSKPVMAIEKDEGLNDVSNP